jgi:hypothetical protein
MEEKKLTKQGLDWQRRYKMDKQKQIEEMEKDIAVRMAMAKGVAGSMNNGVEGWLASYLHDLGYRKIPENAVVLTREEQMARDYECYNLGYETHKQESQKREDYIKTLEHHINDLERALIIARKETAEKFAERLKEMAYQSTDWSHGEHPMVVEVDYIDEICEEFTEIIYET